MYGRKRWALYIPAAAIATNARKFVPNRQYQLLKPYSQSSSVLGLSGDFKHFTFYHSTWLYKVVFKLDVLKITLAWGWTTFIINTVLSGAIISRIM